MTSAIPYRDRHVSITSTGAYLSLYDSGYFRRQFDLVERPLVERVIQTLGLSADARAIDLACGGGRIARLLAAHFVHSIGVDVSAPMLTRAAETTNGAVFVRADAADVPIQDGSAHLVTAFRLYLNQSGEERRRVLHAVSRALSVGGFLLLNVHVTSTSPLSVLYRADRVIAQRLGRPPSPVRNFASRRVLEDDLLQAGLIIVECWPYGGLPRLGAWADRFPAWTHRAAEVVTVRRPMRNLRQNLLVLCTPDRSPGPR